MPRFAFGVPQLLGGFDFIVLICGMFGLAEVFTSIEQLQDDRETINGKLRLRDMFLTWEDWVASRWAIVRGSVIGFVIGMIPAGGITTASFIAYLTEKRYAKDPERFGRGAIEGVALGAGVGSPAVSAPSRQQPARKRPSGSESRRVKGCDSSVRARRHAASLTKATSSRWAFPDARPLQVCAFSGSMDTKRPWSRRSGRSGKDRRARSAPSSSDQVVPSEHARAGGGAASAKSDVQARSTTDTSERLTLLMETLLAGWRSALPFLV
jgi:hypothetical protein